MKEQIEQLTKQTVEQMGFFNLDISVDENEDGFFVQIDAPPEDSGVLIGHHGEGVDAIQLILNVSLNKSSENWTRIAVNINDYRQQREEVVRNMALKAAESAKITGKSVVLNYLPSHERRIAHMVLSQDEEIETYSEGVGKYRRLVVSTTQR